MFCFFFFNIYLNFFQVYSLEDGDVYGIWRNIGVPVTIFGNGAKSAAVVDWLKYFVFILIILYHELLHHLGHIIMK